jgi:TonB-dependent SusC/RagA subfamily outer membrane receptor
VVGRVDSTGLRDVPGVSALGGLAGKLAAVRVIFPSGDPASAPRIRLRGSTVLDAAPDPLVVVDGTITDAPLSDVSAEDIDRIEVLKGPAAAARYGSEGGRGVVLISTRRGDAIPNGTFEVRLRNEVGPSLAPRSLPVARAHAYQITTAPGGSVEFVRDSAGKRILEPDHIADNPYPRVFDQQAELYRTGLFFTNHLTVSGRHRGTAVYAGLENTHDEGVVFALDGFRRQNARVNLDQRLPARLTLGLSGFYGHSDDSNVLQGTSGPFFAVRFLEPNADLLAPNPDGTPYQARITDQSINAFNPLYQLANERTRAARHRLMGGATLRWDVLHWLAAEGHISVDRSRVDFSDLIPNGYLNSFGTTNGGFLTDSTSYARRYDASGALQGNANLPGARITLKAEYRYQDFRTRDTDSTGPLSGLGYSSSSLTTRSSDHAVLASASASLADRIILDGVVRRDRLSDVTNGLGKQWNYRVAGRWNADRDLRLGGFDEIALHAAYGTAGVRPDLTPFLTSIVPIGTPATTVRALRAGELEIGASLESRGGRFALEYAWSRKTARDQIAGVYAFTLFGPVLVPENAGDLGSSTHELTLGVALVQRANTSWSVTIVADRTRQAITDWPLPQKLGNSGQGPQLVYFGARVPYGVMYGQRAVRRIEELYDDPAKKALSGPGQAFAPDSFVVNEEGYVVSRAAWHTRAEVPIRYVTCQIRAADGSCPVTTNVIRIGDANPDFNMGMGSALTLGRVRAWAQVEWGQGGNLYNAARQWTMGFGRDPAEDQREKPEAARKSLDYYNFFYNSLSAIDYFVESATYVKVRELAVSYSFDGARLRPLGLGSLQSLRIGLVGRNLLTFTGYSGYDPGASSLRGDPFVYRTDWFGYPAIRTVSGMVEVVF